MATTEMWVDTFTPAIRVACDGTSPGNRPRAESRREREQQAAAERASVQLSLFQDDVRDAIIALRADYDADPRLFLSFLDETHPAYSQGVYESDGEPLATALRLRDDVIDAIAARAGIGTVRSVSRAPGGSGDSTVVVESAEEILLRCSQELGVLDLVIMFDSALRCGDLDPNGIAALLASISTRITSPGLSSMTRVASRASSSAG